MKTVIVTAKTRRRIHLRSAECGMRIPLSSFARVPFVLFALMLSALAFQISAQEAVPMPGSPRSVSIPAVKEVKLKNGLTVAVVERRGVPFVTVQLLVRNGASAEDKKKAGLANLTASMLTKGTKTKSATQIAEEIEFLGGSIFSFAGWLNSSVGMSITSDKFDAAMAIMSDVLLNPAFTQDELDLAKSQTLDDLTSNLTQPGFLANYVASTYSFGEHPSGGTPGSIESLNTADVSGFYSKNYQPDESILIFVGDITAEKASASAEKYFSGWAKPERGSKAIKDFLTDSLGRPSRPIAKRLLVVDLPNSGQASVNFVKPITGIGRGSKNYYAASVLNSLLGGGYSSRLNQEIRIKRGLSYGAGSNFAWRGGTTNFAARTQTKDVSAAEVAELILVEIRRLAETVPSDAELTPRKSVLTGGFGRNLETTQGLAGALADLYSFGISPNELNAYSPSVNGVKTTDLKTFAAGNLFEGDIIIVGDYAKFKDDLAKRFPDMKIDVVKATELDIESPTLRKSDVQ
ncbi:MAG: pitrilysin family protein [Pyrinomonadaceae bacterium]